MAVALVKAFTYRIATKVYVYFQGIIGVLASV